MPLFQIFHLLGLLFAIVAIGRYKTKMGRFGYSAMPWLFVHLLIAVAGGAFGAINDDRWISGLQITGFVFAIIASAFEEIRDKRYMFLMWTAVHAMIAIGGGAFMILQNENQQAGLQAISMGISGYALVEEGRITRWEYKDILALWYVSHAFIAFGYVTHLF